MRFWALPTFDPQLTVWLQGVDPTLPSIMAARELAMQHALWGTTAVLEAPADRWIELSDLTWQPAATGFNTIRAEILQLQQLMQDDRDRYLAEAEAQADGLAGYVAAFIGADQDRHPWTMELINCGLAMGNVAYMHWKSLYNRVRPSTLCPALAPPFGPPGHPSFPSGHSTLGHMLALFLMQVDPLARRFGYFANNSGAPGVAVTRAQLAGTGAVNSPLIWLAARLARNRERLGLHYPSDSAAGRHLAAALCDRLFVARTIVCPSLDRVLARARAEWAR